MGERRSIEQQLLVGIAETIGWMIWVPFSAYAAALFLSMVPGPMCGDYGLLAVLLGPPIALVVWLIAQGVHLIWRRAASRRLFSLCTGVVVAAAVWAVDWISYTRHCSQ